MLAFFAAPFSLFIFNGNPQNTTIEVMWLIYLCPIGCISLYRYESRHKLELEEARKYKLQRIKDVESPVIATLIVNKIIMWGFTSIEYSIWFLKDSMLFVRVINWWEPIGRSQGDEIGVLYESKMIDEWINRLNGTPKVILQIRRGSFEIAYGKTTKIKITLPQLRTLGDTTYHTTG
ncbi:MAG: hypothetical protein NTV30_07740, partial [Chloroflexi bacterium]|nr:hypothetical protein [Chloroflexota bacterium]